MASYGEWKPFESDQIIISIVVNISKLSIQFHKLKYESNVAEFPLSSIICPISLLAL